MTSFRTVPAFRDLWSSMADAAARPNPCPVPLRPLLDTLGLGLEQVMRYLSREHSDFDAFVDWAQIIAGGASGVAIERYRAWYEGAPPPHIEQLRQKALMATPSVFSPTEITAWERDGVVVLTNAITPDEAGAIEAHLWTVRHAAPDDPATWYDCRDSGIMVQEFQHAAMDVPRRAARVQRAFAQLYGHADLLVSTDRLSFNPPVTNTYAFPGPHLHWDTSLAPPIPFETQAILYLTDTPADQGALRVVPGFHHRLADGWLDSLGDRSPRDVDLAAEAVPIAAGAGDLVIWRQELPHGASANTAARPRMAQYVTMYPMHWLDQRPWR